MPRRAEAAHLALLSLLQQEHAILVKTDISVEQLLGNQDAIGTALKPGLWLTAQFQPYATHQ